MGVPGLSKYAEAHGCLEDFSLPKRKECAASTSSKDSVLSLEECILDMYLEEEVSSPLTMVISGRSLMHVLYRKHFHCTVGGQYDAFKKVLEDFFKALGSYQVKIEAIVFNCKYYNFEDYLYIRKNMTETQLRASRAMRSAVENGYLELRKPVQSQVDGPPLPLLTLIVMVNTLRDMGLPVHLTHEPCDQTVAELACRKEAYILGSNSDFMIYPLSKGYLLLETLDVAGLGTCKFFRTPLTLSKHMGVADAFLPLYAVMMGNKWVPSHYLKAYYHAMPTESIAELHEYVVRYLLASQKQHEDLEAAVDTFLSEAQLEKVDTDGDFFEFFKKGFKHAIQTYRLDPNKDMEPIHALDDPYGYVTAIRNGTFIPEAVLEPPWEPCVWNLSRALRQIGYAAQAECESLQQGVTEILRNNRHALDVVKVMPRGFSRFDPQEDCIPSVLKLLVAKRVLTLHQLLTLVIAWCQVAPPIEAWKQNRMSYHSFRTLAIFETSMVSWTIATGRPISHMIEGPRVHYFYSALQRLHAKRVSLVLAQIIKEAHEARIRKLLSEILGPRLNTSSLLKERVPWILDW